MEETKTLSELTLAIAIAELGKEEIPRGSNWGEHVKKYLASIGINFPASWCMGFVHWCTDQACLQLGLHNPLFKSGGVLDVWHHTPTQFRTTKPKPGDIFIMDFGSGHGHTGFVSSSDGTRIQTIEGNSNDTGSREGYEVCRKPNGRPIIKCAGFISLTSNL